MSDLDRLLNKIFKPLSKDKKEKIERPKQIKNKKQKSQTKDPKQKTFL